jgi:hypothetical protein
VTAMAYWWCLEHATVEGDGECRGEVRLGPYPTSVEAERALQTVKERNERIDAEDRAWEHGED